MELTFKEPSSRLSKSKSGVMIRQKNCSENSCFITFSQRAGGSYSILFSFSIFWFRQVITDFSRSV